MADVELVGVTHRNRAGHIDGIWFDAVVSELHSMLSNVTTHPVEAGSNVADHIRPEPDSIRLEAIVTNTPIKLPRSHADGAQEVTKRIEGRPRTELGFRAGPFGEVSLIQTPTFATVKAFEPGFDRVGNVYAALRQLRDRRQLVTIRTSLRDYQDMAIEEISIPRSSGEPKSIRVSITATQVRTAESETAAAPPDPAVERGKPTESRGRKEAEEQESGDQEGQGEVTTESTRSRSAVVQWLGL